MIHAARAKTELQPVIARYDEVLIDRQVLPLAYHLIGAESLEQALFDGYLRQIEQRHPGAPLPALHHSDAIFADAERLRERDGDERFFADLNGGPGGGEGMTRGPGCWVPAPGPWRLMPRPGPPRQAPSSGSSW